MIRFRYVARDSYMHVFFLFFPFYFSLSVILLFFFLIGPPSCFYILTNGYSAFVWRRR